MAIVALALVVVFLILLVRSMTTTSADSDSQEPKPLCPERQNEQTDHATEFVREPSRCAGNQASISASEVYRRVEKLQRSNAQWPQIWSVINPGGEPEAQRLLTQLRGPYMFAPHLGLNMLKIGCQRALTHSPKADRVDAIREALLADDQIVRPY